MLNFSDMGILNPSKQQNKKKEWKLYEISTGLQANLSRDITFLDDSFYPLQTHDLI